ncbi:chalcone synthase [Diaporthe eres]|nr:chalcone synthase [Diaporthe eres]
MGDDHILPPKQLQTLLAHPPSQILAAPVVTQHKSGGAIREHGCARAQGRHVRDALFQSSPLSCEGSQLMQLAYRTIRDY